MRSSDRRAGRVESQWDPGSQPSLLTPGKTLELSGGRFGCCLCVARAARAGESVPTSHAWRLPPSRGSGSFHLLRVLLPPRALATRSRPPNGSARESDGGPGGDARAAGGARAAPAGELVARGGSVGGAERGDTRRRIPRRWGPGSGGCFQGAANTTNKHPLLLPTLTPPNLARSRNQEHKYSSDYY